MTKKLASKRGFTLIELMVVLAIISILSVIAIQTFGAVKEKGKLRRVETFVMEIDNALSKYAMEHGGKYPGLKQTHFGGGGGWIRYGPAIIGGNGGIPGEANIHNQDDFLDDMRQPDSPYRLVPGQNPPGAPGDPRQKLKPIDELYRERLYQYKDNPFKDKGYAMVNVAYIEYEYDTQNNDFRWITDIQGSGLNGLAPGFPEPGGFFKILDYWDPWDPTTYDNYPMGDFAYIPLSFTTEKANFCEGYWLIGYGAKGTLGNSPYKKLLEDPNWPNFDPPFGDGLSSTQPNAGSFEETVRQLIAGALVVRANIYEDQLSDLI